MSEGEISRIMIDKNLESIDITYRKSGVVFSSCAIRRVGERVEFRCPEGVEIEELARVVKGAVEIVDVLMPILEEMKEGDVIRMGEVLIAKGDKYSPKRTMIRYAGAGFSMSITIYERGISITIPENVDLERVKERIIYEIVK